MAKYELDWPEILNLLAQKASSQRGASACRTLAPFKTAAAAADSMDQIIILQGVAESDVPNLSSLDELPPILDRLEQKGVLDVKQLLKLKSFLEAASYTKQVIKPLKGPWIESQRNMISEFKSELGAINHVVTPQGEISEDASPELRRLCDEKRRLTIDLSRTLDQIVARQRLGPLLQDRYVTTREGRLVIPIKSGSQHDFKGIIHDRSQTRQTVFMEPEEAVPLNNRLRQVLIETEEEINRILKELSDYLSRQVLTFRNSDQTCLLLDLRFAQCKFNRLIHGQKPTFSEAGELKLLDLKHPILVLQGVDVIANSIELGKDQRILLLSGPNAGGKTVLLKSIGLSATMAVHGMPICTSVGSVTPFFKNIDPVIGDLQSVDQNLSTFSSHIRRLNQTFSYKGRENLILIDEICGATDPEEGGALARSIILNYINQGVFAVVTSHFSSLKDGWYSEKAVVQGSLEFDKKNNKPLYQLVLGIPGQSLALSVAKRLGMPESVIERAQSFLTPETKKRSKDLTEIESHKEQMLKLREEAARERQEASQLRETYHSLVNRFREQRDLWLEKSLQKAQGKIERLIEDARQQRLRDKTLHDLKTELPEVVKARSGAQQKPQTLEEFKSYFQPGTPAFSSRLGRTVVVQGAPDDKGQVMVLAGSMRVQLPWHTLSHPSTEAGVVSPATVRKPAPTVASSDSMSTEELDLRGHRVDEALAKLERWLDLCSRSDKDRVKVIHGFGTEQLKKAIRQFLSKSSYVARWTAGDTQTGGDGITWIHLG